MNGRRVETHHYTPEQVREHLDEAIAILTERAIPVGGHEALLVALYNSLAAKQITIEQIGMSPVAMAMPKGL